MATGTGLGGLLPIAMAVIGIFTMLRSRSQRRKGDTPPDDEIEDRQAATRETERRMAAYLASRDRRE